MMSVKRGKSMALFVITVGTRRLGGSDGAQRTELENQERTTDAIGNHWSSGPDSWMSSNALRTA